MKRRYQIVKLSDIDPVPCPCGTARRTFADIADSPASVHLVTIKTNARIHYHKRQTEIYVVLEGSGHIELDSDSVPVEPMTAVLVRPDCRHRAVGNLTILNIVIPPFDPKDECFD
ncbi:MAG: cupin domain-containing protein [Phycisphaerae bacterium]|nr:cupin domain-containing protein [Phycisphaerae bacterium]